MKIISYKGKEEMNNALFSIFKQKVIDLLIYNEYLNIGIATGNTFISFIDILNNCNDIPLDKINLFMIDEYANVDPNDVKSCAIDLINEMKCLDKFHHFYAFNKDTYLEQIHEYNSFLLKHPFDILLLGIGENGHYGFNNYPESTKTTDSYKTIAFSDNERQSQVDLGWFDDISQVPSTGISITEFAIQNSSITIFAAYYDQKKTIIDKILDNNVCSGMAIYPIIPMNNCLLIYG